MKTEDYLVRLTPVAGVERPEASLLFTVDEADGRRRVSCARFRMERQAESIVSHEFDNGSVIVDLDEADQFVGLEVLAFAPTPADCPEIVEFVENNELLLVSEALAVTMACWHDLQSTLSAEDLARETFRRMFEQRCWGLSTGSRLERSAGMSPNTYARWIGGADELPAVWNRSSSASCLH